MSFSVKVEPSGHIFSVDAGESVLDAALRQGFALPYGCRNGACGSCMGKIVAGEVQYQNDLPSGLSRDDVDKGMALFCQAIPTSNLVIQSREISINDDIPVKILPCRIVVKKQLNHDVMLIKLKLPSTERMQFLAGQYVDFLLKDGRHRSFSLANAPHDDEFLELHIRHIEGGRFTSEVFDSLQVKDIMRIEGPMGSFFLREESGKPIIFMAGGTGFAPIKGMIEHMLAAGIDRSMHLYWGARAKRDLYMHDLAQQWADDYGNIHFIPVLSEPQAEDHWSGRAGFVHEAIMADYDDLNGYEIYASGPPAMIFAGRDAFLKKGLELQNYFSDAFEYNKD